MAVEANEPDYKQYKDKEPTDLQARFAPWITEKTGYDPAAAKTKQAAFEAGVRLAVTLRIPFQASDENREATEQRRILRQQEIEEARAAREQERLERQQERQAAAAEREAEKEARAAAKAAKAQEQPAAEAPATKPPKPAKSAPAATPAKTTAPARRTGGRARPATAGSGSTPF